MRYFVIPTRVVNDPVEGPRPTRVSRFAGGFWTTEFTDPDTGEVHEGIRDFDADRRDSIDFRYPVDPGLKYRTRKDGSVRPIGWKRGISPSYPTL